MSTVNPDSVAQDQIRSFVDRILRLRAEQRAIKGDEKEVYAEAKGNGFDKTVMGKIVLHVERLSDTKSAAAMQEQDALFDLYLEAYFGKRPSHTHAHAREDVPPHDAETGEIIESTGASQRRAQTATGLGAGGDHLDPSSRPTATAKTDVPSDQSQASGGGQSQDNSGVRVVSVDTHSETPMTHASVQPGREEPGTTGGAAPAGETANNSEVATAAAAGESPADHRPTAVSKPGGENVATSPAHAPEQPGQDYGSVRTPAEGGANSAAISADRTKPNPLCADPDDCGVEASWNHMCGSCLRRRDAQRSAAEAMH